MLKTLKIENFQSHERTELHLHPGVNVICGRTDGGKSAILRAVRWVIENRPQGDEFRSWWGGDTKVALLTTDDVRVERGKGKSSNWYDLNIDEDDPLHFEAFGPSVPNEIIQALKLTDVNFQWQHDRAFLLSESAPEVARRLNKVARIEDIDAATTRGEAEKRAANAAAEAERQAIADLQVELSSLPDLKPAQTLLTKMDQKSEECDYVEGQVLQLLKDCAYADKLRNELAELPDAVKLADACAKLESKGSDLSDSQCAVDELTELLSLIENARSRAETLSRAADLDATALDAVAKELAAALADLDVLESVVESCDNAELALVAEEEKLTGLVKSWNDLAPDACPLCGKPGFADSLGSSRRDSGANPSEYSSRGEKRPRRAISEHYEPS